MNPTKEHIEKLKNLKLISDNLFMINTYGLTPHEKTKHFNELHDAFFNYMKYKKELGL